MSTQAERAAALRKLLAHVREAYGLDLGFVLWDGSMVPADLLPARSLLRLPTRASSPRWCAARPSTPWRISGSPAASICATAACSICWRSGRGCAGASFARRLDKFLALRSLSQIPVRPRGGPWPLEAAARAKGRRRRIRQEQEQHPVPLRPLQRVLRALARSGDGLFLRLLHRLE